MGEASVSADVSKIIAHYRERYYRGDAVNWRQWLQDQSFRFAHQRSIHSFEPLSPEAIHSILKSLPEPSYQEVATSSFIGDYMLSLGYVLVSTLQNNTNTIPKQYETELIFRTRKETRAFIRVDTDAVVFGKGNYSHACGHSINLSSVLTVAQLLRDVGIDYIGFIFQPAEEGPGREEDGYSHPRGFGGGQYLRAKGIYEKVPTLLSCHIDTSLEKDHVRISHGLATAAAYRFSKRAIGKEAHAALPWQGKNPIEEATQFIFNIFELNKAFQALSNGEYGLVTPSQLHTTASEINSLASHCTIQGISRVSGGHSLQMFHDFMKSNRGEITLEAPPVYNSPFLVEIARSVAHENNFQMVESPARFRDETAWAGPLMGPFVESPERYGKGCDAILHFFTSNGGGSGGLHSTEFNPNVLGAIERQVAMLMGIVKGLAHAAKFPPSSSGRN